MTDASDTAAAGGPAKPQMLLGARRFLPLFLVQALGAFNDNVFKNAFIALLTFQLAMDLSLSLEVLAPLAAGLFILPFALFAPFAGKIADRIDKAAMMRQVKLAEILLMIVAAIGYQLQNITLLFALLFLMGAQSAFFSPIKYGVLPQYLRADELVKGNGLMQAGTFLAILMGTIVGTKLVLTEFGVALVSVAVVGIAVIGWVASLYAPPAPPTPNQETGAGSVWTAHAEVLRAARADPTVFRSLIAIAWFWFVGATFMSLLAPFTKNQLGGDENVLTLLLAAFSVGVALGSVLCSAIYRGAIKVGYTPWAAAGIAVFSIDLWLATEGVSTLKSGSDALMSIGDFLNTAHGWRVLIDFVALAACAGLYITPLNAVYQNAAPEAERGRIVACSNMIDSAFMAASAAAVAVMNALGLSTPEIFAIVGGTGAVAAFLVARWAPETRIGRAALAVWPMPPPDG